MYEYLDRPPAIGDVVECFFNTQQCKKDNLYIVTEISSDKRSIKAGGKAWMNFNKFKVVKTKPATKAKVGDTVICITPTFQMELGGIHKGYISTVTETEYHFCVKGYNGCYTPNNWLVLCRKEPDASIKVGSYWERNYTSKFGEAGDLIEVKDVSDGQVYWINGVASIKRFLEQFHPRPDLDKPQLLHQYWKDLYDQGVELECKWDYEKSDNSFRPIRNSGNSFNRPGMQYRIKSSVQETVESTNQITKEQTMTFTQLIDKIFGQELTDYEKRPNFMVIAFNRDGSEKAVTSAESVEQVTQVVQANPELWGCKLVTYKMAKEVFTDVPVTVTKSVR